MSLIEPFIPKRQIGWFGLLILGLQAALCPGQTLADSVAIPLQGTVQDASGAPLAYATIELEAPDLPFAPCPTGTKEKVTTKTGQDGTFKIEIPEPGFWQIRVSAPDHLPLVHLLAPIFGATKLEPISIRKAKTPETSPNSDSLESGTDYKVKFLSSDGTPVIGASVRRIQNQLCLGHTDSEGFLTLSTAPLEPDFLQVTTAKGASAAIHLYPDRSVLRLPPIPCITGQVVDTMSREPVTDSWIWLRAEPGVHLKAQADGRFELCHSNLRDKAWELQAQAPDYAPAFRFIEPLKQWKSRDLGTIFLEKSLTLTGKVVDQKQAPIVGVTIFRRKSRTMRNPEGRPTGKPDAISDEQGEFQLESFTAGQKADLLFWHNEFQPKQMILEVQPDAPVSLVKLKPAIQLTGRVLSAEGKPLLGARVMLHSTPSSGRAFPPQGFTNPKGQFEFENLDPKFLLENTVTLSVQAPGYTLWEGHRLDPSEPLEIVLEPGASTVGQVKDPDGKPVANALVNLVVPSPKSPLLATTPSTATDADGRFELTDLPTGSVTLEATHPRFRRIVFETTLTAGKQEHDLQFEEPLGHSVSGRIVDEKGSPLDTVEITLAPIGGGISLRARSNTKGQFSIEHVVSGRYEFRLEGTDLLLNPTQSELVVQDAPQTDLELRLYAGGLVEGQLLGLDASTISKVRVLATRASARRSGRVDPGQGTFRLQGVSAGVWQIEAQVQGTARRATRAVQVSTQDSPTLVDIEFGQGFRVTGSITRDHQPMASAGIALRTGTGQKLLRTTTDAEGAFEILDVEAGTYRLEVEGASQDGKGQVLATRTVQLTADQRVDLDIDLASVSGSVIDLESGETIPGALVQLSPMDWTPSTPRPATSRTRLSKARGEFLFEHLPYGRWRLTVEAAGYGRSIQLIEARKDQELTVELQAAADLELLLELPWGGAPAAVELLFSDSRGTRLDSRRVATGVGGKVRITNLPPGVWQVAARTSEGFVSATTDITIPSPAPVSIPLVLGGGVDVLVPELLESGGISRLSLRDAAGKAHPWSWSNPTASFTGHARLPFLTPGVWTLILESTDGDRWQGEAQVVAGTTVTAILETSP